MNERYHIIIYKNEIWDYIMDFNPSIVHLMDAEQVITRNFDIKNFGYLRENAKKLVKKLNADKVEKIENETTIDHYLDPLALEEDL